MNKKFVLELDFDATHTRWLQSDEELASELERICNPCIVHGTTGPRPSFKVRPLKLHEQEQLGL
jgi:hypothetical protein